MRAFSSSACACSTSERMGLALDYFRRASGFTALGIESLRDWPRPEDDAYAKTMAFSDPVFAVWGRAT